MYRLKQVPEDFRVEEVPLAGPGGEGRYGYYWMRKRDWSTLSAIHAIAHASGRHPREFGFAGTKDKRAVTAQLISVLGSLHPVSISGIELAEYGRGESPLLLGMLEGNRFSIVVRGLDSQLRPVARFVNLFGSQRFSRNIHLVGKAMVKKDFQLACTLLLENNGEWEGRVRSHLMASPRDAVGALRKLPKEVLLLYVHAFQSSMWNRCAEALGSSTGMSLPVVGFGTELDGSPASGFIQQVLDEEGVSPRDFLIRQIPSISSEGSSRQLYADISGLSISSLEPDDLNPGKKKCTANFRLSKGCYATVAIHAMAQ